MDKPLVSVIMATYNEPIVFIKASIESILNQTYSNFELIIADDSTNKETIEAIDFYCTDNRVHILRQQIRMGFVNALNEGLKIAKGEYIARMDGDDISALDRFEKQISFFLDNPSISVLGGAMSIINGKNELISSRQYPATHRQLCFWSIFRSPFAHPTVMMKSSIIQNGIKYDPRLKKAEDIDMWLKIKNKGYKFSNLTDRILNYRVLNDLSKKRNIDQWKYNFKARLNEFSFLYPVFSIASILVSSFYCLAPNFLVSKFYSRENQKDRVK